MARDLTDAVTYAATATPEVRLIRLRTATA